MSNTVTSNVTKDSPRKEQPGHIAHEVVSTSVDKSDSTYNVARSPQDSLRDVLSMLLEAYPESAKTTDKTACILSFSTRRAI